MGYIKDLLTDIGDLGSEIYRDIKRKPLTYAALTALTLSGCCKPEPEEPVFRTEAEMSKYFEKAVGSAAARVNKDLRMTKVLPPTKDGWVTINADYEVTGKKDVYVELFSTDDGLNGDEIAAIKLADDNGMLPEIYIIHSGKASEIDKEIKAAGL
ncbi:MAG: hypothetical protein V1813_00045 [Candidatus Aenigmatarchaeota archaeon]